jgi:hypothetical protein
MSLRALAWRRMQTIAGEVRFDMPSDGLHVTPRRLFEPFFLWLSGPGLQDRRNEAPARLEHRLRR